MRLMHLSDLHLGKRVYEFSMYEDQKYILKQILEIAGEQKADAVLISGDVYDKPIPPAEAVQLFDDFLTALSDRKVPVYVISGNHDSAERLSFGARLMTQSSVFMSAAFHGTVQKYSLQDEYGTVNFYLLPFLKPTIVRQAYPEAEIGSYQEAVQYVLAQTPVEKSQRNVLLAHQFVTGAKTSESEEILVGGLDNMDASLFDDFDYVALGHIHTPQKIGRETVRYCGTPLKYSFSEAEQKKSVVVLEIKEKGDIFIEKVPLKPLRDLRKIRGTYMELMSKDFYEGTETEDYLQITLTDEEDVPDGMAKLRTIYPNLMRLEYDNKRTRSAADIGTAERVEEKSELELFQEFYELQNNQSMTAQQEALVEELLRGMKA